MRHTDHRSVRPRSAARTHDTALFVALELSRSTWLIGSSTPGSDRISKHQVPAADTTALLALLKRLKARAERYCDTTVSECHFGPRSRSRRFLGTPFPGGERRRKPCGRRSLDCREPTQPAGKDGSDRRRETAGHADGVGARGTTGLLYGTTTEPGRGG